MNKDDMVLFGGCECCKWVSSSKGKGCGASQCGAKSNVFNLIIKLFCGTCLHTMSDDNQTRTEHTTQIHSKHHHHGGGSACPSSDMDLMNQDDRMCGRPGGGVG